jgi:hypothetical protein
MLQVLEMARQQEVFLLRVYTPNGRNSKAAGQLIQVEDSAANS